MLYASRPISNLLIAALILSVMVHGLAFLWMSLARTEAEKPLRVVARVDVVDKLQLPTRPVLKQIPRLKVPPPPLQRPVQRAGYQGTRPGVGGDPAPAPKSLRMELPRNARRQPLNPNSSVLSDRSIEGDPDRGNAFGDPNGVHGATGAGGNGPGGTGGGGDGGFAASTDPLAVLRAGAIKCNGCHISSSVGPEINVRPLNIEMMSQDTGWNIGSGPQDGCSIEVQFEHHLDAKGRVLGVRILKTASDPVLQEAMKYFAAIHEFTPPIPAVETYVVSTYLFYPPGR